MDKMELEYLIDTVAAELTELQKLIDLKIAAGNQEIGNAFLIPNLTIQAIIKQLEGREK